MRLRRHRSSPNCCGSAHITNFRATRLQVHALQHVLPAATAPCLLRLHVARPVTAAKVVLVHALQALALAAEIAIAWQATYALCCRLWTRPDAGSPLLLSWSPRVGPSRQQCEHPLYLNTSHSPAAVGKLWLAQNSTCWQSSSIALQPAAAS